MGLWARVTRAVALACAALFLATGALAAPLETYGRLPLIEDAQISPDGTMIAYAVTDGENRIVMIRKIDGNELIGGIRAGDQKVRDVRWGGNAFVIITASQTSLVHDLVGPKQEYLLSIVYDIATRKQRGLMDRAENSMNVVYAMPQVFMIDGELTAVVEGVNFVDNRGRAALFKVKLKNGQTRTMEPGFEDTIDWVVGADGKAVAQTEYDQKTGSWKLKLKTPEGWRTYDEMTAMISRPWLGGLGRDGKSVLVVYGGEDDVSLTMREYAVGSDKPKDVTARFDNLIHDPASKALIGTSALIGDDYVYTFYDPKDAAVWRGVVKAYPADNKVNLVSWSADRRKIVVRVDNPADGSAYALVDLDARSAVWLGSAYAGLDAGDIAEVRPVSYKARDGLTITGYLTLPRGKDPKNLPLVVLPHGGPAARDVPGFDWWAQALASRGYAVLQPNFRGSEGFGDSFLRAGYGEWGKKMQTDLSDGVRDLAAKGLIDPRRVCIVGASYGGYAALAGVTLDRGVYRCAAAVAGVSDLKRFMDSRIQVGGPRDNSAIRYWSRFLGVDGRRDPDLTAISPAQLADRADAPVLLVHGKDDTVVLYDQSKVMNDALKRAGKPVEFVTLQGEDHWLSRGDTRLQMLRAVVAFLEKHNPPS
ncbi:MAG: S9 family peptidase [Caulobacter sp.]|nr:S9 family peptidase [Caulobacter sp.]